LFTQEFCFTWRNLSDLLGFLPNTCIDIDEALKHYGTHKFWTNISKEPFFHGNRTRDIEHPTLRFLHKWLGTTFIPWDDASKIRVIDLQLIYAVVKKIRVSPMHASVDHWLSIPDYKVGDIAIYSIVTRLAIKLKIIAASLDFIDTHRQFYGYEHFNHAHIVKRIKRELFVTYGEAKLWLPNLEMALYSIQTLHIELQARPVNRRGVAPEGAP
jgi:hypothetical protein